MSTTINDVRFSYCNLFQPQVRPGGKPEEAKYSVTILVPKTNVQAKAIMDAAVQEAINAGVSKAWNGQRPPQPSICIHDGDGVRPSDGMPYGEECKGCWVFTASSKQAPFVVDANVQNIMDPREVYSGMWGNVSVNFFAYNSNGKKGIGCGLNGIQKTRDDTPLANRVTAEEAFRPAVPAPDYGQPATPAYGGAMPATPGAAGAAPWGAPVPATPAPGYGQLAAPAAPGYPTPAPVYGSPAYGQPAVDPITGQPVAPGGYSPTGAPIMGL